MTGPPPRRRRLPVVCYAHPFELSVAVVLILSAIRTGTAPSALTAVVGVWLTGLWVAAVGAGGLAALAGLAYRAHAFGRTVERAAMYAVAGACAAYAVAIITLLPAGIAWHPAGQLLAIGAGSFLRARAIAATERVILNQLRAANRDAAALRRLVDGRPPEEDDQHG